MEAIYEYLETKNMLIKEMSKINNPITLQ